MTKKTRSNPMETCTAKSKQSGQRCRKPPENGRTVCRMHGAYAGPKTAEGRARIAAANTTHGAYSKSQKEQVRIARAMAKGELHSGEEETLRIIAEASGDSIEDILKLRQSIIEAPHLTEEIRQSILEKIHNWIRARSGDADALVQLGVECLDQSDG